MSHTPDDELRPVGRQRETNDTLVRMAAFTPPERYRGGYVVPWPVGHRLTVTYRIEAEDPGDPFAEQGPGSESWNLAERINRAKRDPAYAPFAAASPNGGRGVIAAAVRGAIPDEEDDSDVLDLTWFHHHGPAPSSAPSTPDEPACFHLYLKEVPVPDDLPRTVLYLRDGEAPEGCSVTYQAARAADRDTRQVLRHFLDYTRDRDRACAALTRRYIGTPPPALDRFGWPHVHAAIGRSMELAQQVGQSTGGAWLGIFLANYFRLGHLLVEALREVPPENAARHRALVQDYFEALVLRHSHDRHLGLHTRVGASLHDGEVYAAREAPLRLRHLPLFELDGREHEVRIGFGQERLGRTRRRQAWQVRIRYVPFGR